MWLKNKFANLMETTGLVKANDTKAEFEKDVKVKSSIRKDLGTIVFLIFLYFLQAIPLGLNRSISLILGSRSVTYGAQGTFSFVSWPFSLKIFWAPIVDTLFFKRFGRRRSWIIPLNLMISVFLICFGSLSNKLLYHGNTQTGMYDLKIRVIMTNVLIELVYFHFCGMNMK
jgi:PAT family acetyl-CoA transporter-like MFS transporter 1